jgi:hypothetical protein
LMNHEGPNGTIQDIFSDKNRHAPRTCVNPPPSEESPREWVRVLRTPKIGRNAAQDLATAVEHPV